MTLRAYVFFASVIASFHSMVADALPAKYVETAIDNSQTCMYAMKWEAPKTPRPPELGPNADTPIIWENFLSERQTRGYNPLFQPGPVSFAYNGRPLIRDRNLNLQILMDDGTWQTISLFDVAMESLARQGIEWTTASEWPNSPLFGSGPNHEQGVVFDRQCHAYTVVNAYRSSLKVAFLLHSPDGGHSWAAYKLPGWDGDGGVPDGGVRMELPSNTKHVLSGPPVIVLHQHPPAANSVASAVNRAVLLFPEKAIDGTLNLVNPNAPDTHVTVANTVCCGDHSGGMTQVVSDGDLVHFAYPGSQPRLTNGRWGTPQFVMTFRRSDRAIESGPTYVGTGFDGPAAAYTGSPCDVDPQKVECEVNPHNQPALAIDTDGFLHVVIGGHGAEMKYRRSSAPHVTKACEDPAESNCGWNASEDVGHTPSPGLYIYNDSYTYPGLIVDDKKQPHVFSRWADTDPNYHYHYVLVHRMRDEDGEWSQQKKLLDPGRKYSSEWYHKVSIDPWNRMFVSYSFVPQQIWADEAREFGSVWGFTLRKSDPTCPDYNVSDQGKEGATTCAYEGYNDVSPGMLISIDAGASFQLGTTDDFFRGVHDPVADDPPDMTAAIKLLLLDN